MNETKHPKYDKYDVLVYAPQFDNKNIGASKNYFLIIKEGKYDENFDDIRYFVDGTIGAVDGGSLGSFSISESEFEKYNLSKEEAIKLIDRYQNLYEIAGPDQKKHGIIVDALKEKYSNMITSNEQIIKDIPADELVSYEELKNEIEKSIKADNKKLISLQLDKMVEVVYEYPQMFAEFIKYLYSLPAKYRIYVNPYDADYGSVRVVNYLYANGINMFDLYPVKKYSLPKYKPYSTDHKDKTFMDIHASFASSDALRPSMLGTYFSEEGVVTTDAHRLLFTPYKEKPTSEINKIFCHTSKCFKANNGEDIVDQRYPNYAAVIPRNSLIKISINEAAIYNFLENSTDLRLVNRITNSVALKTMHEGEEFLIGFNANFLSEAIKAMVKLGHKELEMSFSAPNRAALLYPKGQAIKAESMQSDLVLIMPIMLAFTGEKAYTEIYDLDSNCMVWRYAPNEEFPNSAPYCFDIDAVEKKELENKVKSTQEELTEYKRKTQKLEQEAIEKQKAEQAKKQEEENANRQKAEKRKEAKEKSLKATKALKERVSREKEMNKPASKADLLEEYSAVTSSLEFLEGDLKAEMQEYSIALKAVIDSMDSDVFELGGEVPGPKDLVKITSENSQYKGSFGIVDSINDNIANVIILVDEKEVVVPVDVEGLSVEDKRSDMVFDYYIPAKKHFPKTFSDYSITEAFIDPYGEVRITSEYDIPMDVAQDIEEYIDNLHASKADEIYANGGDIKGKKLKPFDTVHVPEINKTGYILSIVDNKCSVKFINGEGEYECSKVEKIKQFGSGGALNPYAVCTSSISKTEGTTARSDWGDAAKLRYENCVLDVKEKNDLEQYAQGGRVSDEENLAKMLIISSDNPLSSQLQKETGDSYNAIDFDTEQVGNFHIETHRSSGKKFIVYPERIHDKLTPDEKQADIDYLNTRNIKLDLEASSNEIEFPKYNNGGDTAEEFIKDVKNMHKQIKEVTLKDGTKIPGKKLMASGGYIDTTRYKILGVYNVKDKKGLDINIEIVGVEKYSDNVYNLYQPTSGFKVGEKLLRLPVSTATLKKLSTGKTFVSDTLLGKVKIQRVGDLGGDIKPTKNN